VNQKGFSKKSRTKSGDFNAAKRVGGASPAIREIKRSSAN
jgi:hypothetical protein